MAAYSDRPVDADREVQTRAGPTIARRTFRPTRGLGVLALVLASSATLVASSQAASVPPTASASWAAAPSPTRDRPSSTAIWA
jgi:hypothetical protein